MKAKKDVYYFSHDANAHQDPKTKALMSVYGAEGYGWYWILIEIMRQQQGYGISIAKKYDIPSLSSSLPNCSAEKCKEFIDDCIKEFELFSSDEKTFWSESLLKRMEKVDSIVEKRRNAANKRWSKNKKTDLPFPVEEQGEVDVVEHKKLVDPSKIKSIKVLNDDQVFDLFVEQLRKQDEFKNVTDSYFQAERNKMIDWLAANGKVKKDYKAFFRQWIRKDMQDNPQQAVATKKKSRLVL
jgi:hypothetical protein